MADRKFDLEKIGVYIAALGAVYMFWTMQNDLRNQNSDMRERIKALEVRMDKEEVIRELSQRGN